MTGSLLPCGSCQLSGDLGVALFLTALQILTHLRETGTCGDELTDDDVLLQTGQRIDLALDGGLGQHAGGLLEGGGRQEGLVCQSSLGDAQQHLLILDQLDTLLTGVDALLQLGIDILDFQTVCQSTADEVGRTGVGHADLAAHLTDDDLDMLIVDLNALQTVDLLDLADEVVLNIAQTLDGQDVIKSAANEIREGRFCKRCGEKLEYRFYHYSQLGDYYCPKCGFARPKPDFDAEDVKVGDQLSFCVEGKHIVANYKGFYNVYNILAAYAGVRTAGFAGEHFGDMLRRFNPENGRMEQFRIKGTGVTLNLAKNPAGFNQNISAVMQDQAPKDIIIAINDNAQDGTDISWLWDVDFDLLGNDSVKSITVSGIRCQDMRLRLKYVDIPSVLEGDVEKAIRDRVEDGVGNLYVLVNYTALFSTRNILKKLEGEHK